MKRATKIGLSLALGAAAISLSVPANAQTPDSRADKMAKPASEYPWFVAIGAGVSYPLVSHPQIATGGTAAPTFSLHGGRTLGDHFSLGFEFSGTEAEVGRDSAADLFELGKSPQAGCNNCAPKPPGAEVLSTALVFSTVGARAEYTPFSRDGLFVGGTVGLAFLVGLDPQSGFGFGGRIGYRLRASNTMALSIEGGVAGQLYGDTTMYMPYGAAVFRPSF